jgi:hypothetical protein
MPELQMDRLLQRNDTLLRDATGRFGDNLEFLKRLDRKVTIHISEHKPGEPYQEGGFGL